jgi:cation diffusion facilitator family transporter
MKGLIQRDRQIRRVILIEGGANLLVLLIKLAVGLTTGSLAVLGDAIHSLTDLANNIVAWVVIRLSGMPADAKHPYGHRKFETLAVFSLAALLVVLAIELALRALQGERPEIASGPWELGLMLGVLAINIVTAIWQRYWARRLNSDIILADASHTLSDVMVTTVVILGWQLSTMGYAWLDTLCALAVAALVLFLAYDLFKRAIPILVDQVAIEPDNLLRAVQSISGVLEVKQVRSRWIGQSRAVDMVVSVAPSLSLTESHEIANAIENLLKQQFHVSDSSIHVEPQQSPAGS